MLNKRVLTKLSFMASLIGILVIAFVFEFMKPNNKELVVAKFSDRETEEILVSGRIVSFSEDENKISFKFEVCSIVNGIAFKDKLHKNYSMSKNANVILSGKFDRKNFIVTSIK
ncbi:MAG: hypothetical protein ACP5OZ_04050 [Candidatus Woesearchaeota archaeon]